MAITVNAENKFAAGLLFAGVAEGATLTDATGNRTVNGVNGEATTNARGAAVIMRSGTYYKPDTDISFAGRSSGIIPTGMTYLIIGDIDISGSPSQEATLIEDDSYKLRVDTQGNLYSHDGGVAGEVKITDSIKVNGENRVILFTIGDENDPDLRLYVDTAKVITKTSGLSGWYQHVITSVGGSDKYPGNRYAQGKLNRALVWNKKLSDADCMELLANPDQMLNGLPAPATAPDAPTNVVATAGLGAATVSFTPPANDGGSPITGYKVTASTGQTATGTASPITVNGLSATSTTFSVQAINAQGTGPASAPSNAVTPQMDTAKPQLVSITTNADGTAVILTYNEALTAATQNAAWLAAYAMANRSYSTFTLDAPAGKVTLSGISPVITISDPVELSYVKPASSPLQDVSGNQADAFSNLPVTNAVAPYAWRYLGNEGATATVGSNITVRYGVPGQWTTKVLSGTFNISNGTFGVDPAPGATKYAEAYEPVPEATAFVVTMGSSGPVGTSPAFTVEANGFLLTAKTITLSGAGLTFTPSSITLGPNRAGYAKATFTISSTEPVNGVVHFATTSNLTVPADKPYRTNYEIIKTIGPGKDFVDLPAFAAYVYRMDVPAVGTHVVGEAYVNLNGNGVTLQPFNSSAAAHVILRPAPEFRSKTINKKGYGAGGLKITGGILDSFGICTGVEIVDFDLDCPNDAASIGRPYFGSIATGSYNWGTGGSYEPTFTNCRIRAANPNTSISTGGYGAGTQFINCQIIQEEVDTQMFSQGGPITLRGCALVRRNGTFTKPVLGNCGVTIMENCWGMGLGGQMSNEVNNTWSYFRNNVLDAAITVGKDRDYRDLAPVGYVVSSNFVVDAVTDITPTAGSVLLNGASYRAQSTEDMLGNNRGLTPDVGPIQRTPAAPLVVARVTSPTIPEGESLTLSGTTVNTPSAASITLVPANPANGAIRLGPFPVTLGAGTFTVTVDDIVAGDYLAPVITFTNDGGVSQATGATAFSIMGMEASLLTVSGGTTTPPDTTTPPPPAPTLTMTTATAQIMAGKTATVSGGCNLQGASDGKVEVFADPQPSGASVALGAANVSNGLWTKQATLTKGLWKLRAVATANAQTVSVSSGDVRVLGLFGNFTLPSV